MVDGRTRRVIGDRYGGNCRRVAYVPATWTGDGSNNRALDRSSTAHDRPDVIAVLGALIHTFRIIDRNSTGVSILDYVPTKNPEAEKASGC